MCVLYFLYNIQTIHLKYIAWWIFVSVNTYVSTNLITLIDTSQKFPLNPFLVSNMRGNHHSGFCNH